MKYGWKPLFGAIWAVCAAGVVVIAALSLGWTSWVAFAVAGVVGLVVGVPAGIWNARKLRRDDPNWEDGHAVTG